MSLDMNEQDTAPEPTTQNISIDKLLAIIGKQYVEWIVNEESVVQLKAAYQAVVKQKALLEAPSPELESLRKMDAAHDLRVRQLEEQVHTVAMERDAAMADLKKAQEAVVVPAVVKGKKR